MRESKTSLVIHGIWATWDRLPLLVGSRKAAAYRCLETECRSLRANVIAIGGTDNHVHLFAEVPATLPIATWMKQVKGSSSHLLNHDFPGDTFFKWQGAYAAYSISHYNLTTIAQYIQNQERHHAENTCIRHFELDDD